MSVREKIENVFVGRAFERPLFYRHTGGLRFKLSESGSVIEQFLTALEKSMKICSDVFPEQQSITVCLRLRTDANRFQHRSAIAGLEAAGIFIPKNREVWLEEICEADLFELSTPEWWLNVAFTAPRALLQNLLWCALARDLSAIHPRSAALIYLFNLETKLMVWPYDDRGMDIVGSNKDALARLYTKYSSNLLEYDRAAMDATFATRDA